VLVNWAKTNWAKNELGENLGQLGEFFSPNRPKFSPAFSTNFRGWVRVKIHFYSVGGSFFDAILFIFRDIFYFFIDFALLFMWPEGSVLARVRVFARFTAAMWP
jgi:hypothetical protein